jgi:hypothetical protein
MMDKYKFEEWTSKTVALVEADSEVQGLLWERYADEAARVGMRPPTVSWKQKTGVGMQIGKVDGRPVVVSVMWNVIGGQLVGFYSGTSQVVDYKMIEEFLEKTFKNARKFSPCNFISVIAYLRTLGEPVSLEPEQVLGREAVENFRKERYLSTHMLGSAEYAVQRGEEGAQEIHDAAKQLGELAGAFRDRVWQTWLKRDFEALPSSGASCTVDGLQMLVFTSAGRVMVSLRREEHEDELSGEIYTAARNAGLDVPEELRPNYARRMAQFFVSLIGQTGKETGMYLSGVSGDQEWLSKLLSDAIENSDLFRQNLSPNTEVGLAV